MLFTVDSFVFSRKIALGFSFNSLRMMKLIVMVKIKIITLLLTLLIIANLYLAKVSERLLQNQVQME